MDWIREAVLTRSPATIPSPSAPIVTAASRPQIGRSDLVAERRHGRDQIERRTNGSLRVVLGRGRRAPDRHHRIADELLDRTAVDLDQAAAGLEVARQDLAHLLGITRF